MFIGTSINESPVIAAKAGDAISNGAMLAAEMGNDGTVDVVSTQGNAAVGLIIPESEASIAAGDDVTIQVKDIGLWIAGAAVNAGALLMSDANGKAVAATAGNFYLAQALEAATAAGQAIHVQIIKGMVPSNGSPAVSMADISDVDLTDIANGKILKYNSTTQKWECEDDATA